MPFSIALYRAKESSLPGAGGLQRTDTLPQVNPIPHTADMAVLQQVMARPSEGIMDLGIHHHHWRDGAIAYGNSGLVSTPRTHDQHLQTLVRMHGTKLYRFIYQKIGHAADAQDLVQQTFLEAHRALASFKGDSELSTWLYGIAKNLVRNYLSRSPHRRFEFCSDALLMEEQDAAPSPMDVLEQGQQLQALTQAMSELPDHTRQLVWMVVVDELSYDEAAAALQIPKGTVRSRLSRARSALRERMLQALTTV